MDVRQLIALTFVTLLTPVMCGVIIIWTPPAVGGGQIHTLDCSAGSLTGWTQVGNGGSSVDLVSGECLGNLSKNAEDPSVLNDIDLDTTDNFGSMKVVTIAGGNSNKIEIILRAPALPGVHYACIFNNNGNNWAVERHGDDHGFISEIKGIDHCSCGPWFDVNPGNWIGCTVEGEGFGTNESTNTRINWWNWLGTLPGGGFDIQDSSTWTGTGLDCTCTAAQINTENPADWLVDVAGACGPERTGLTSKEILYDDFTCGDIPQP